ncbi:hypothetical protein ASC89_12805 [Devosia sp. Root413D1]|uniref:glycosyltransferase family 4 protein n=1 Tax=Devosia sp. Root413D1 TaxID=1736531 RepID=UPI0006F7D216|nr:glycosyltransferase family 4 protein [Devosia sp. Root413D1]KQW79174.1 hypothetical protein ASC89_12805 [Devosia sp. Root413D1]
MRLLVVTQYFWPETFRINDLVAELSSRGHEVTVLTGKPNYPDGQLLPDFAEAPQRYATYEGATIVRLPMLARGKGRLRLLLNYASFALSGLLLAPFKLRGRPFDAIFVCQLSPVSSALPAVLMRRLRRIPSTMWVLDLWPQSLVAVGVTRSAGLLGAVDWLVRFIYQRTDLLLGQSHAFVTDITARVGDPGRVAYLPGWSEPTEPLGTEVLAAEVPSRQDMFTIVFTGNVGEAQDFPALLDAMEALRGEAVRLIVVGSGRKGDWVRDEIARRELSEKVSFVGRFPPERMPEFYRHADALLVSLRSEPSFAMTIPAKIQAYLSAGRPILAMLDGEGAEVVAAAGAGLAVSAGDVAGLTAAVRQMMAMSPVEREAMGRNGTLYADLEFNREKVISRLEEMLSNLVEKGTSSSAQESRDPTGRIF